MSTSTVKIPVGEMARQSLGQIFPHLTPEQVVAIKDGKPVPPSPDWIGAEPGTGENIALRAKLEECLAAYNRAGRERLILDATIAHMKRAPLVTAILVFGDKHRIRRARKAVNQFVDQSYPNKQLVIVNNTDLPVTNVPCSEIRELQMVVTTDYDGSSVGGMRNFAIDNADGDLLFPHWDDDDVYDKHLLSFMVANFDGARAVLLDRQVRIDIKNSVAYQHFQPSGIPNTMLVPKTAARYEAKTGGEDVAFWSRYWSMKAAVVRCEEWPLSTLRMCVHDGNNVLPAEEFMVGHAAPDRHGKWELTQLEAEHVRYALEGFGLKAEIVRATESVPSPV